MNRAPVSADSFDRAVQRVLKNCDEIVLFGSRSLGNAGHGSDWDVLCVGDTPPFLFKSGCRRVRLRSSGFWLDLVWTGNDELHSSSWLGSELAGHIARYGHWIRGDGDWRAKARVSKHAIYAKRRRIEIRADFQRDYANDLLGPYVTKHLTLLRRDIQRLKYLKDGLAVPVTPQLDGEWREHRDGEYIYRVAQSLGCNLDVLDPETVG